MRLTMRWHIRMLLHLPLAMHYLILATMNRQKHFVANIKPAYYCHRPNTISSDLRTRKNHVATRNFLWNHVIAHLAELCIRITGRKHAGIRSQGWHLGHTQTNYVELLSDHVFAINPTADYIFLPRTSLRFGLKTGISKTRLALALTFKTQGSVASWRRVLNGHFKLTYPNPRPGLL